MTHPQTGKLIARMAENLPQMESEVMQEWIDNPPYLREVLRYTLCSPAPPPELKVFKTIRLGTRLQSAEDFIGALRHEGCSFTPGAISALQSPAFTVATEETEVDLVAVSVAELGLGDRTCYPIVYKRARDLGLELCPPEVGPQLRLQYMDQPYSKILPPEALHIGMKPIAASDGRPRIFAVENGDRGLHLDGWHDDLPRGVHWYGRSIFVFRLPRVA